MPLISWEATNYVKKKYSHDWENELKFKISTSVYGGTSVFEICAKFNDPIIDTYKAKWDAALRQLLFSVLFSLFIIAAYIYAMGK